MELKDVILSTLAEMEDTLPKVEEDSQVKQSKEFQENTHRDKQSPKQIVEVESSDSELIYLNSIRERLLVLFEGFQAPNNVNIEAKVDLTLNFLEYVLATIDSRVESLEKGSKK